jgi:imidazoleglycerol-phosphate dehydratase/histidinol-phosphatase
VLVCPHFEADRCTCRKPQTGLVQKYLAEPGWDRTRSYVIGDRQTDLDLARNMGIQGFRLGDWALITSEILSTPRKAFVARKTKETEVSAEVNLDGTGRSEIQTGLGFFDHMLEQLSKHGGFDLKLKVEGDLHIDDHHTIEDTALVIGEALRRALGDKVGIARYGFFLPMDEATALVGLDLSGREYSKIEVRFSREKVGELSTEMVPHFFRSLASGLQATLHLQVTGENTHHMVESMFKAVGRSLRQAIAKSDTGELPSTKGLL